MKKLSLLNLSYKAKYQSDQIFNLKHEYNDRVANYAYSSLLRSTKFFSSPRPEEKKVFVPLPVCVMNDRTGIFQARQSRKFPDILISFPIKRREKFKFTL